MERCYFYPYNTCPVIEKIFSIIEPVRPLRAYATSNQLSCTHIYIHTHSTTITNSTHIYTICVALLMKVNIYTYSKCTYVYSSYTSMATHMYEEIYPKYLIVGRRGGGVEGTLPNCTGEQPMSPLLNSSSVKHSMLTLLIYNIYYRGACEIL